MTIKQYLKQTTTTTPFLHRAEKPAVVLTEDFQRDLTDFIRYTYSDYRLRRLIEPQNADVEVPAMCDMVYRTHEYTYQRLYESTQFEYNPIENYDMKEHGLVQNTGNDVTKRQTDAHEDTLETRRDAYTNSETLGDTSVSDSWGQQKSETTNTDKVAPFESENFNNKNNSFASETRQAVTDTHTSKAVENIYDNGEQHEKSTQNYGKQGGQDTLEHGHNIEHDLSRSGNVGVTTTQEMLEQERRIVKFNLVRVVANDIIQTICSTYVTRGELY